MLLELGPVQLAGKDPVRLSLALPTFGASALAADAEMALTDDGLATLSSDLAAAGAVDWAGDVQGALIGAQGELGAIAAEDALPGYKDVLAARLAADADLVAATDAAPAETWQPPPDPFIAAPDVGGGFEEIP